MQRVEESVDGRLIISAQSSMGASLVLILRNISPVQKERYKPNPNG